MKTILALTLLIFGVAAATHAQTTTNVTYRIQVESVTGGVTNTVSTNWRYDAGGVKKDQNILAGIQFAYAAYVAAQGTNTVLALGPWLKQQHVALLTDYANQKQAADNTVLAAKILNLLTVNSDLLSASDLTSLNTIAAKAP